MKNTKKAVSFILTLALIAGAITLFGRPENRKPSNLGTASSASWSEHFSGVEEMEEAADIGIVGVLADSKTELRGGVVFTRNTVEVLYVHAGDVQAGDFVEVLQTGGVYGTLSTPPLAEAPLMEENKEYALFLKETTPHERYGQYYLIVGGYQGIAEISGAAPPASEEKADAFADYFTG